MTINVALAFSAFGAVSVVLATSGIAQPPPPPPPGMPAYVEELDQSYNGRDLERYLDLFSSDVHVFKESQLIASNRAELKAVVQAEFDQNLHVWTLSWAQGNQILVMQSVVGCIPVHPLPNAVYHGCPQARAIRYDLDTGKSFSIATVHILPADAWNMHRVDPAGVRWKEK